MAFSICVHTGIDNLRFSIDVEQVYEKSSRKDGVQHLHVTQQNAAPWRLLQSLSAKAK